MRLPCGIKASRPYMGDDGKPTVDVSITKLGVFLILVKELLKLMKPRIIT